eukprot:6179214-Pleurochrysis_carterae.AAC.4
MQKRGNKNGMRKLTNVSETTASRTAKIQQYFAVPDHVPRRVFCHLRTKSRGFRLLWAILTPERHFLAILAYECSSPYVDLAQIGIGDETSVSSPLP